jgi:hypothetical protein
MLQNRWRNDKQKKRIPNHPDTGVSGCGFLRVFICVAPWAGQGHLG